MGLSAYIGSASFHDRTSFLVGEISFQLLVCSQLNGMHEAAKNKREADANRARLEAEIETAERTMENDLNTERRKKLQEKQRVRRQVEDEIAELSSELFSKKVRVC